MMHINGRASVILVLSSIAFSLAAIYLIIYSPPAAAMSAGLPTIVLSEFATGLTQPTFVTHAGDHSDRLFVVERPGRISILKNGALLPTPFLDITDRVRSRGSEQGLLSVAFPPGFSSKQYFYVDYTDQNGIGNTVISRFRVTANLDVADPSSEQVLLSIQQPEANHNGGQLQFGPDGFLYIGMGDGGGAGDRHGSVGNAQNPGVLLGKMLRINVEPEPRMSGWIALLLESILGFLPLVGNDSAPPVTYTVPSTNPFVGKTAYRAEIWATGVRNPWRFSFDRQTRDLYIADVGQGQWEEINVQAAASRGGENYGWRILEGDHCFNPAVGCSPPAAYSPPVAEYNHAEGGCSVTGGYVYRGPGNPAMQGMYFYGDYCSGMIWGLTRNASQNWESSVLLNSDLRISSFGEDEAGRLYITDLGSGIIYQVESE